MDDDTASIKSGSDDAFLNQSKINGRIVLMKNLNRIRGKACTLVPVIAMEIVLFNVGLYLTSKLYRLAVSCLPAAANPVIREFWPTFLSLLLFLILILLCLVYMLL